MTTPTDDTTVAKRISWEDGVMVEQDIDATEFYAAPLEHKDTDMTERLREQIDRLAGYIMHNVEGEPSKSEGAVDCAIRIIDHLTRELDEANARADRMREAMDILTRTIIADFERDFCIEGAIVDNPDPMLVFFYRLAVLNRAILPDPDKRAAALSDLAALDGESM
jgi:hypothetical protein